MILRLEREDQRIYSYLDSLRDFLRLREDNLILHLTFAQAVL